MPHSEQLASSLHAAHNASNEAREAVHSEIDAVLDDGDAMHLARALLVTRGIAFPDIITALMAFDNANIAHTLASNAYLKALGGDR